MYRLHYEVKGGYWCVQFAKFGGAYWSTVRGSDKKPIKFETLAEATKYVSDSGIAKHYRQHLPYQSPSARLNGREVNGYQPITFEESNGRI